MYDLLSSEELIRRYFEQCCNQTTSIGIDFLYFFNHTVEINRNQKLFEIKLLGGHSGRSPHPVLGFLSSLWETLCSVAPPGGGGGDDSHSATDRPESCRWTGTPSAHHTAPLHSEKETLKTTTLSVAFMHWNIINVQ